MWSDTARIPLLWIIDARVLVFLMIFLMKWSWVTFYIAIGSTAFFSLMLWVGVTPTIAWSYVRYLISGKRFMRRNSEWRAIRCWRLTF